MQNTIIGVFDDFDQAQGAMNDLISAGFSRDRVQLNPHADSTGVQRASSVDEQTAGDSGGSGIGHFFRSLFGMEDDEEYRTHHDMYSEATRRGSSMLTVEAADQKERDQAISILQRHNPVDLDRRSESWRSEGWTGYDPAAPRYSESQARDERARYAAQSGTTGSKTAGTAKDSKQVPVIEEQLKVGKRAVSHGGVRVFSRVTEKPVHESVDLRKEQVKVGRKRVDKPASQEDLAAFKEGSMELRESSEEPVVSKEARVVEEVEVSKQVSHETANIDDKVRRTDVDVERLDNSGGQSRGKAAGAGGDFRDTVAAGDDADFRTHWQNAYGRTGGSYEDYDAAYRYGSSAGGSERYRNYRWEDAEPHMRSDWEANHPESSWDRVKDAVRYGAEKATGRRGSSRT